MQSPLPAAPGTQNAVIDAGFRALQRRLQEYGGQLVDNDENVRLLATHMKAHGTDPSKVAYKAEQILDALWLGTCELFSRLKFDPLPQKLYMVLLEAKNQRLELRDKARRDREAAENLVPFDLQARVGAEQEKKSKEDQKIVDAKAKEERERIIHDYSVNASTPGRIDHTKSEEGRAYLTKIKITDKSGRFSEVLTLQAVQAVRWYDSVQAMSRALDQWLDNINNAKQNEHDRTQQERLSGFVGARGRGTWGGI